MKNKFLKYCEFGLRVLKKLMTNLQMCVSDVLESKNRILKYYIVGMIIIIFSSILISTTNFLAFLPKSYDLNPILPVNRYPVYLYDLKMDFLELACGYRLFSDSIKIQGRLLVYQIVIASVIAKIYMIDRKTPSNRIFQQGYVAFLLILISLILIVGSNGSNIFLEGKISWLILFSTALGIFLLYAQFQQK